MVAKLAGIDAPRFGALFFFVLNIFRGADMLWIFKKKLENILMVGYLNGGAGGVLCHFKFWGPICRVRYYYPSYITGP